MGLQANPQNEIVQEIETLPRGQANISLDPEAVEMTARRQALWSAAHALEQRFNADTRDHVGVEPLCS